MILIGRGLDLKEKRVAEAKASCGEAQAKRVKRKQESELRKSASEARASKPKGERGSESDQSERKRRKIDRIQPKVN